MKHTFGKYWNCCCGSDTMNVACQKWDGHDWVTREAIENCFVVRQAVEEAQKKGCPLLAVQDLTNVTCDRCGRRIDKNELEAVHKDIPKVPFSKWKIIEEPGIVIFNDYAVSKVSMGYDNV